MGIDDGKIFKSDDITQEEVEKQCLSGEDKSSETENFEN